VNTSSERRPRADFARNRVEIVEAAERRFADDGVTCSLETVARDAGIGSATLYRHFPTREALLAEVLQRRVLQIEMERERIANLDDAAEALVAWLMALEDFFGAFEGLPGPMRGALLEQHHPLATTCTGFIDATDIFLRAAQDEGKARSTLRGRDLFLAALSLSWTRGANLADDSSQQRLRDLYIYGLSAQH
jgi:AcrR family transcriptional regulator